MNPAAVPIVPSLTARGGRAVGMFAKTLAALVEDNAETRKTRWGNQIQTRALARNCVLFHLKPARLEQESCRIRRHASELSIGDPMALASDLIWFGVYLHRSEHASL